jgi:hypothetical protein
MRTLESVKDRHQMNVLFGKIIWNNTLKLFEKKIITHFIYNLCHNISKKIHVYFSFKHLLTCELIITIESWCVYIKN